MPNVYRAYLLEADGSIKQPPLVLEVEDDAAAVEAARLLVDGQDVEIWQGKRRIEQLAK